MTGVHDWHSQMLYTTPIADIINSHNLHYHFYADDTQLYVTFKTNSDVEAAGLSGVGGEGGRVKGRGYWQMDD